MQLSAPKVITFIISLVVAILALIGFLAPTVPLLGSYPFWILLIAWLILAAGNLLEGV